MIEQQFPEWLSFAANDGRGGISAEPPSIVRGFARSFVLNLSAHPDYGDWSGGAFTSDIKSSPGAVDVLASWSIVIGTPASGVTPVTFTLAAGDQDDLPVDSELEGVTELMMQVNYTPLGGAPDPIIQTRIILVEPV